MEYLQPTRKKVNPEQHTNALLGLLFVYLTVDCVFYSKSILTRGYRKELSEEDIYEVLPSYKSKTLGDRLEKEWEKLQESEKPSIFKLLWKSYGKEYLLITSSLIIPATIGILQPKVLKNFISYFTSNQTTTKKQAYFDGFFLILTLFVNSVYSQNYNLRVHTFVLKMRAGFTSLIYRKILSTRSSQASVGKTVTLITKDLTELENITFITTIIQDVVACLITFYVLYSEIGWMFLLFVFAVFLILLPDMYLTIWIKSINVKCLKTTEKRYQQTKEVLSSIKIIKMFLCGEKFQKRICELRQKEVRLIKIIHVSFWLKYTYADAILEISWYCLLVSCIYLGQQLNAETLFLVMNVLSNLFRAVKLNVPYVLYRIATVAAIFERIENFLQSVDTSTPATTRLNSDFHPTVEFSRLVIYTDNKKLLENLDLKISIGVTAINGPIGSGKSVLLKVIAKEHLEIEGNLTVNGTISYASQEPWLFPESIKQNILFGDTYDEKRYFKVLRICALVYDLKNLKDGDQTIVADRGVNLSKGQRIRINLARAVYKKRDIYLLDDCLSNLDNFVADYIYTECIKKFLAQKVVIMVSQNLRHISAADNVITLGGEKTKLFVQHPKVVTEETDVTYENEEENETDDDETVDERLSLIYKSRTNKQVYDERNKPGHVGLHVYQNYVASGGYVLFVIVLLLIFPIVFLILAIPKLESKWVNSEQILLNNSTTEEKYKEALQVRHQMIYLLPINVAMMTFTFVVQIFFYWTFTAKISINLHKLLLSKVIHATMKFFDTHLIGSILNRFSEDLLYIDKYVAHNTIVFLNNTGLIIGVAVLTATVNATFFIPCLVSLILLIFIRKIYLKSGRALKRLEISTRSPLVGVINATIDGLPTIRILKQQNILKEEFDKKLDLYISCSYLFLTTAETFYFIVELCGICFVASVVVIFMVLGNDSSQSTDIGLVLTQTIRFIMFQYYVFRCWADLENDMTTTERILEYTKEEQEQKKGLLIGNWPHQGQIQYRNINFSYNDNNCILQNLNFCIESKEKVAVIGRTGSGKTSMIYALLRFYNFKGKITIDGVDITTLPLDFYRLQISVIPQDPILFTGTLRENIDPTGNYTDEEIWTTITTVKLCTVFRNLEDKISDVNSNLSIGQKQLICLCRVLIRKSKIIIIDELTANVDDETVSMINKIIDKHFSESTIIMVTHKLQNILRYDKVLVLDKGQIIEFGCPTVLLENKKGMFYKMYKN